MKLSNKKIKICIFLLVLGLHACLHIQVSATTQTTQSGNNPNASDGDKEPENKGVFHNWIVKPLVKQIADAGEDIMQEKVKDMVGIDITKPNEIKDIIEDHTEYLEEKVSQGTHSLEKGASSIKKGADNLGKLKTDIRHLRERADETIDKANMLLTVMTIFCVILIAQRIAVLAMKIAKSLRRKRILRRKKINMLGPQRRRRKRVKVNV